MRGWPLAAICLAACQPSGEPSFATPVHVSDGAVNAALEGLIGDPQRGFSVFTERDKGHCILCHSIDGLTVEFQGNVGPSLTGIGDRLTAAEIRYRIIGAQQIWPETVMPSYYQTDGLNRVGDEFKGRPALSAQQIEDLVAYLSSLEG